MPNLHQTNAARMAAVREARNAAEAEARESVGRGGVLQSRGIELVAVDAAGDKVNESAAWTWDGTLLCFERDVRALAEKFPQAAAIHAEGGFDYAESPRAMNAGDYDPWVSDWSVKVWVRDDVAEA